MDGAPSPRFGLSLLGGFELIGPDGVVDLPSKKLAGLLAYLACTAPRPQPRERLSALFWGSHFDAQAKQNLRQAAVGCVVTPNHITCRLPCPMINNP
jgi:DNA-binding SARP family transcriptional activator